MGDPKESEVWEEGVCVFGQDADDILCGLAKIVGVSDFWEFKRLWEELDSLCMPSGRSGWDISGNSGSGW